MKKKNKIIITATLIIVMLSFITINISKIYSGNKEVVRNNKNIVKQDAISMMYETSAGSGEYAVSTNNAWPTDEYVINEELSGCENGSKLIWDDTNKQVVLETTLSDKCYIYFDIKTETEVLFADYIKSLYTSQGTNGIYYHTSSLTNGAGDNSYRYAGASPNNYVCFGSDASTCPSDNLYRIIGVFGNQVKLIKASIATTSQLGTGASAATNTFYWSGSSTNRSNLWENSTLNTSSLNSTFLINIGTTWSDKIATTSWKIGGMTEANGIFSNARTAYNHEVGINSDSTTHLAKVGLMYISDYYYAASSTYWTYAGLNESDNTKDYSAARTSNWLYLANYVQFTITANLDSSLAAFAVAYDDEDALYGSVAGFGVSYAQTIRPTFYLTSNVVLKEGTGTNSNPYRIA